MNKKTAIQRIFLIRHGQSLQNIGLTTGQDIFDGDVPLSPLGEKQAYEAGAFLKKYLEERKIPLNLSALWESPYLRAEQTANGIKKHIRFFRNYQDPRLVERDMGLFDNIARETWDEIAPAETHIANDRILSEENFSAVSRKENHHWMFSSACRPSWKASTATGSTIFSS